MRILPETERDGKYLNLTTNLSAEQDKTLTFSYSLLVFWYQTSSPLSRKAYAKEKERERLKPNAVKRYGINIFM